MATRRGLDAADRNDALLLGRFIARARKEAGMTQATLARRLGLSGQGAVSEWERGASKPDVSLWPRIAHVLGVDVHDMAAVIWGPWSRDKTGELVTLEDLAAQLTERATELQKSAPQRGEQ